MSESVAEEIVGMVEILMDEEWYDSDMFRYNTVY